jgi:hypothetical protein
MVEIFCLRIKISVPPWVVLGCIESEFGDGFRDTESGVKELVLELSHGTHQLTLGDGADGRMV